jgi:hypothetical protein
MSGAIVMTGLSGTVQNVLKKTIKQRRLKMIIKLEDKVKKFEEFLTANKCLEQFKDNLANDQNINIEELVRDADYPTMISGAFPWEELQCSDFCAKDWRKISDQWYTLNHAEVEAC